MGKKEPKPDPIRKENLLNYSEKAMLDPNFPEKIVSAVIDSAKDISESDPLGAKEWAFLRSMKRKDLLTLVIGALGEASVSLSELMKYYEDECLI